MTTKSSTFSSVISGSPMITSEKLVGCENYLSWFAFVELWFMGQGYEDHLVTQEADIPEVDKVQWRKIDAQLCSVLWQSVDPKILHHLRAYKTCFKFWNQAKGLYTNDIQRLYKVASSIVNVKQQDMNLSTYIDQIASLKEEFLTVMPLTTDVGDQCMQIDKFFMVLTLIGLRPDLETVRDQILGSSSVPSLDDVFARLLRISSTQTLSFDNTSDSSVLVSQTNSRGGRSGNRGRGQRPHYTYCNKLGHTRDRCYQLHGRPPTLPTWPSHLILSRLNLPVPPHLRIGNASACLTHTSSLGPWILDFGASDHISGNKDLFSSITTTSALPTVTLANGSQTMAKGFGFAHSLPSLPFHSVLYAPECPFNLISISKITRTLNCSITFSDKFVTLQDRSTGKTIGIRRESQGLYHLTSPSPAVCISTDAPLLIHSCLGHPNLSKFQKMVPSFSSLSSLACESCQLGKHTRVSFPKRLNNRAKSPFELDHTDVWGPCRTVSTLGFQYFVTFIDDYSRCTCDNAREYFSAPFTLFMSQHGIIHQSSCAHTPQQNGVAEPCYLINRMPSSVLHDQIPHSLIFPDQPLYFLPPRVFGCTCFVHILTPGQDKLSAKTTKCIFLDIPDFKRVIVVIPLRLIYLLAHFRFIIAVIVSLFLPSLATVHADSPPIPSASPAPALPPSADLPIALRKVGCRWVYTVKVGPDGQVDRLKARLVAKGYTQVYGFDYGDTFSPVAKIAYVRLLLSMAAMRSWPLYQLDIKNVFLHGDLAEEVYMEQPPGFVAQGESGLVCRLRRSLYGLKQSPRAWFSRFSSVVQEFGMFRSTADHSVFYHHNSSGQCIYLVVYVDDIVITGSDQNDIQNLKQHLFTHFQTKDLGKLKYFLGIEIAQSSSGVVLSQRKYALDILEETGMLDCKPVDTPMDPNVKLIPGQGEPLGDPGRYRRLVGKLNYLTITRPNISFPVSVVSQFLQSPCDSHWDAVIRILRYIKSTPGQGNLISWKSKKQDVVTRSSAEAEYRAMCLATCELIWLKHLLRELRFGKDEQMKLICDNQAALHIASNPVFYERTKHIEVDCHFIREKIASGCVVTSFVNSNDQLADIFTKSLRGPRIKYICNKLGAYNIYAPA
ncbi:Retrovirus-related Pol polyprotein from transposon RE1 [Vitis vinifera]|uniref:Retrovirus-related Pol polyprotein from transposon RE1 n=1 Tax=Vitis vinifera TaxID=29760 RepID=A0A438J8D3_VITVI|nr:Retrovirus-related Pol polyprotein from transposon RE1 [Vitis vinifera]